MAAALTTRGAAPPPIASPLAIPGYQILGEVGRGGMGVVYQARHLHLQRLVALKMIRADGGAYPEQAARFLNEARVIAGMRHANIIQIHEVGECGGQPYLSLEFVEGGGLDKKLHGTPIAAGEAAHLVETLARAMQAAHEQGIIHRDLKPANVLLAPDGTPKITDFGLAKRLDQTDGQTQSGAILGTPSYMAPEQAGGRLREIGPASDVYALGALLYECLTGRPPFLAATPLDTLMLVLHEEPVAPRRLNPRVPRDVETVCLKCLHKEPGRRYASAAGLAEDLRRWQAGEPIHARPVGTLERGWKWARKRPAVVSLLAMLVLGVAAAFVALRAEQARTARQRDQAIENLQRALEAEREAKDSLQQARKAVDECFGLARDDPLLQGEGLRKVRQLLLQKTLPFYRAFTEKSPDDEAVLARQAEYLFRAAYITSEIGRKTDALKGYEQARDVWLRLSQAHPGVPGYQAGLATTWNNLGILQSEVGQPQGAMKSYEQARDIRLRLVQAHPGVPGYQAGLATSWINLGVLQGGAGNPQEGLKSIEQSRDILLRLSQAHPGVTRYQADLAITWNNLGVFQREAGHPQEALKSYEQARDIRLRLVQAHPGVPGYQAGLATSWINLGVLQREAGHPQEALRSAGLAIELLTAVREREPRHPTHRLNLRNAHRTRALTLGRLGRYREALADWEEALRLNSVATDTPLLRLSRASSLARAGDYPRAMGEAEDLAQGDPLSGATLHDLACVASLSALAVSGDSLRPLPARDRQAELWARRAVELLQRAAKAGHYQKKPDRVLLDRDGDLDFLRERADFKLFVRSLPAGS